MRLCVSWQNKSPLIPTTIAGTSGLCTRVLFLLFQHHDLLRKFSRIVLEKIYPAGQMVGADGDPAPHGG
jgi:hypothetical protein